MRPAPRSREGRAIRDDHELSEDELALKRRFVAARGYWRDWTDFLLKTSPDFIDLYARYGGHAADNGPLDARLCELVYVALDASSTHMFEPGLKLHLRLALEKGASVREIVDVLRLATAQGLHGTLSGIEILADELGKRGSPPAQAAALDQALADRWTARVGDWPAAYRFLAERDPEFLSLVCEMNELDGEGLARHDEACIRIALAACFTGYSEHGLRGAIRQALDCAIPADAILQILQMTAHLGVHSFSLGAPALNDVLTNR
ncbi:MAG: carboxymuconolactone decarboxylase family protein [Mesorhizobium sp.]